MLPLFLCMALAISFDISAQTKKQPTDTQQQATPLQSKTTGGSQDLLEEWEDAIKKASTTKTAKDGQTHRLIYVSKLDRERMESIYNSMSEAQRAKATKIDIIPRPASPTQAAPSKEQLQTWTDASLYGVWLDGKRISNDALKNYQPADFAKFYVSKLMKNAKNYGEHDYQVDLMSPAYFKAAVQEFTKGR